MGYEVAHAFDEEFKSGAIEGRTPLQEWTRGAIHSLFDVGGTYAGGEGGAALGFLLADGPGAVAFGVGGAILGESGGDWLYDQFQHLLP